MKAIFQKTGIMAALAAATLLSSCSDDHDTPQDTALDITLASSATSTTLWNTVKLTATVTADQDIDKIEIRIDGTPVGTATSSPYEFSWDTQKVKDGPHTATAIVTDQSGQEKSAQLEITVQNILLETKVDAHMLRTKEEWGYDERGFIFLSDDQGKVITAQEFRNGDDISLRAPSFEDSEFSISQVITPPGDADEYTPTTIITHTRVSRGKWTLTTIPQQIRAGTASLSFTNFNTDLEYILRTNDLSRSRRLSDAHIGDISLQTSPSLLYITSQPAVGSGIAKYHIFPSIVTGNNPDALDLALVDTPLTDETVTPPQDNILTIITIFGLHTVNGKSEVYDIGTYGSNSTSKLNIQYPGEGFDSFLSSTSVSGSEYDFLNSSRALYDFTPLAGTLNASLNGRKATVAATGAMDLIIVGLQHDDLQWSILAEKSATSIVIPQIPDILNDVADAHVDITNAGLTIGAGDYPGVQDYKTYLDFIRASTYGAYDLGSDYKGWKSLSKTISNPSGGRLTNGKKRPHRTINPSDPYFLQR